MSRELAGPTSGQDDVRKGKAPGPAFTAVSTSGSVPLAHAMVVLEEHKPDSSESFGVAVVPWIEYEVS